jgi:hypothetical protein
MKPGDRVRLTEATRARYLAAGLSVADVERLAQTCVIESVESGADWDAVFVRYPDGLGVWSYSPERLEVVP